MASIRDISQKLSNFFSQGLQRVSQTSPKEFFLPTSTPFRQTVQQTQRFIQPKIQQIPQTRIGGTPQFPVTLGSINKVFTEFNRPKVSFIEKLTTGRLAQTTPEEREAGTIGLAPFAGVSKVKAGKLLQQGKITKEAIGKISQQQLLTKPTIGKISLPEIAQKAKGKSKQLLSEPQIAEDLKGIPSPLVSSITKGKIKPPTFEESTQAIINAVEKAKPLRATQEAVYTAERGAKLAKGLATEAKLIPEKGYEKAFFAKVGSLKGAMSKLQFESVRKEIQPHVENLFKGVKETNLLNEWEKIPTGEGVQKILTGQIPTEGELRLLDRVFGLQLIQSILAKRPALEKLGDALNQAGGIPKAILASTDLSMTLRQSVLLSFRHPLRAISYMKPQVKAFFSDKEAQDVLHEISTRKTARLAQDWNLPLTDLSAFIGKREEAFTSRAAEQIPILGRLVKASNRAAVVFLNKMRMDEFDNFVKIGQQIGAITKNLTVKDPKYMADAARWIGVASGRGGLGPLERNALLFTRAFFSPRLMSSRLQTLYPKFYIDLHPAVRKEAIKTLIATVTGITSILTLAKLAGAVVETNSNSADYAKIKIGNTRLDITGGFQQYLRIASQLITGKMISTTTGREFTLGEGFKPLTRGGILSRFFENKTDPVISFALDLLRGKTGVGEDLTFNNLVAQRFIPMIVQDTYDAIREWGAKGALVAVPAALGIGVQTYGYQLPKELKKQTEGLTPDQIKGLTQAKLQEVQMQADVDKIKSELTKQIEKGKVEDIKDTQPATFTIDGVDYQGFNTGEAFIYVDEDGKVQSKSLKSIEKGQVKDEKGIFDAEYSLTKDRLKRVDDYAGLLELDQLKLEYYKEYQKTLDPVKDKKEWISAQNTIEDLEHNITKGTGGYGKKGRKPAKISIKSRRVAAPKLTLKKGKLPAVIKPSKTPTLKLSKTTQNIPKFVVKPYTNTFLRARNVIG